MTLNTQHEWAVDVIESEKGWGQRLDETRLFETHEEAIEFMKQFNSHNDKKAVPDWYMYATLPYRRPLINLF